MSVEIYDVNEAESCICLPVSSERMWREIWERALADLDITRLGNGVMLHRQDLPEILRDFQRMRQWAQSHLSGESLAYVLSHIDEILQGLPRDWMAHEEIERLYMG